MIRTDSYQSPLSNDKLQYTQMLLYQVIRFDCAHILLKLTR